VRNHEVRYKKALTWTKQTGKGILENDGAENFESKTGKFNYAQFCN